MQMPIKTTPQLFLQYIKTDQNMKAHQIVTNTIANATDTIPMDIFMNPDTNDFMYFRIIFLTMLELRQVSRTIQVGFTDFTIQSYFRRRKL